MKGITLLLVVGLTVAQLDQTNDTDKVQPNIIFIMGDDHGWNDIGYRNKRIHTPNMDRLAGKGVILDNYYTAPNCGPSRVQFLTGKYLTHLGLQHLNLSPCRPRGIPLREKTIADELKDLGYTSHMIGKWHAGYHTTGHLPTNRGFQTFRGMLNGMGDHYRYTHSYKKKPFLDFYNDTTPYRGAIGRLSTDVYKERALELIEAHNNSGDPMFMWLSFQAPHTPLQAASKHLARYSSIKSTRRRHYAAMVTTMDEAIGEIVERLEETGMMENTVLIYSSDNGGQALVGGASNYPLRGNKATYYEAGIRALSFVYSPLLKNQGVSRALFHITDWKPTFLHLAGGVPTGNLDGVNQWQVVSDGAEPVRQEVIYNIDPLKTKDCSRIPTTFTRSQNKTISIPNNLKTSHLPRCALRGRPKKRGRKLRRRVRSTEPERTEPKEFDSSQLAAIRFRDWKLISGDAGYNRVIPDPEFNIKSYELVSKSRLPSSCSVQLYNITADPTESNDLSKSEPGVVRLLLRKLSAHELTARRPFYPRPTTLCNPALHGNVWAPYIEIA